MSEIAEREGAGESRSWRVRGMDCPSCVAKIEKAVSRIVGVQEVSVNLMAETLTARVGSDGDPAAIVRTVESLNYKASPQTRPAPAAIPQQGHKPCFGHDHDHDHADERGHDHGGGGHLHAHGEDDEEPGVAWWRTGKAKLVWLLGVLS